MLQDNLISNPGLCLPGVGQLHDSGWANESDIIILRQPRAPALFIVQIYNGRGHWGRWHSGSHLDTDRVKGKGLELNSMILVSSSLDYFISFEANWTCCCTQRKLLEARVLSSLSIDITHTFVYWLAIFIINFISWSLLLFRISWFLPAATRRTMLTVLWRHLRLKLVSD